MISEQGPRFTEGAGIGQRRLLDYDPDTKTRQWFIDKGDEGFQIYTEQDVADVIEANKAKQNTPDWDKTGEGDHLYASIPNIFVLKFLDKYGVNVYGDKDHLAATFRLLDNPDYRWLKTTEKKHFVSHNKRQV